MSKREIRAAVKRAKDRIEAGEGLKSPRTLSLEAGNFVRLQAICKANERSVSEVVDMLISEYVATFD